MIPFKIFEKVGPRSKKPNEVSTIEIDTSNPRLLKGYLITSKKVKLISHKQRSNTDTFIIKGKNKDLIDFLTSKQYDMDANDIKDIYGKELKTESIKEGDGLWANIHKKRKSGRRMRKPGEKGAPTAADFKRARGENVEEGKGKPESFEAQFKRRVVKTTKPDHKEKGYNWRIKGKDRPEISIKLYKEKPGFAEFKKQLRRVAGHEFG